MVKDTRLIDSTIRLRENASFAAIPNPKLNGNTNLVWEAYTFSFFFIANRVHWKDIMALG